MASGAYLDDIAQLVDEGKVCAAHCIARGFLVISVTCPASLVSGDSAEVGPSNIHAAAHGQV